MTKLRNLTTKYSKRSRTGQREGLQEGTLPYCWKVYKWFTNRLREGLHNHNVLTTSQKIMKQMSTIAIPHAKDAKGAKVRAARAIEPGWHLAARTEPKVYVQPRPTPHR